MFSGPGQYAVAAAVLAIILLALAAPVAAAETTIDNSSATALADAIASASDGDVIILQPGAYFEYGITVSKSITIRANTSYDGNAGNTVIYAASRVFSVSGGTTNFAIDNLTLCNPSLASYGGSGGGIRNDGATVRITSTSFSGFRVNYVGAGDGLGGTIYNNGGTLTVTDTTFSECKALEGGCIYNTGTLTVTDSTFTRCPASAGVGGAIDNFGTITSITSSSFAGCTIGVGGAIANSGTISTIRFSRFNNDPSTTGLAINNNGGTIGTFINNWWGTNTPGFSGLISGLADPSSWLVLTASSSTTTITTPGTATIRMSLTKTSDGTDTASGGIFVPDTVPVAFSLSGVSGSLLPVTGNTLAGTNTTLFAPVMNGTAMITVTVDGQSVTVPVDVTVPDPAPGTTTDQGMETSDDDAVIMDSPARTVTVNIGGDSRAYLAVVTGTGLKDLIVTGTVQDGSGTNRVAPPGTVYQYISLVPARYTTITNAELLFSVPQAWLDENGIDPSTIVLYHLTETGWVALPTTVVSTKDGTVYFSATTSGFSLFAIAGTPGNATTTATTILPTTQVAPMYGDLYKADDAAGIVTTVPVTTQTTAPPASPAPAAEQPPVMNIVLVIALVGILGAGVFFARRWLLRRQNPALFED
jgi:hypothetical protein